MSQSKVCPICTCWMSSKIVNNIEWLYCCQNHHFKVVKKIIELIPESPTHAENADEYYKKKRNK